MIESRKIVAAGLTIAGLLASPQVLSQTVVAEPRPPPISSHYLQYGVGITAEAIGSHGSQCSSEDNCVLRNGAGLALRMGYRSRSNWYFGGAYESSRQDSGNLIRLAILQQLRVEARFHWMRATRLSPYALASLGAAGYGNEWAVDTGGATASLGGGLEFQITRLIVVHLQGEYRPLLLRNWQRGIEPSGESGSDFGLAHLLSFELGFELREPLARW